MAADGKYNEGLERAHKAAANDPRFQCGPEHMNAKNWTLRAPDGTIYGCRNLLNFFREHSDLIDGTPRQAWDGVSKIKYSMQGKRKHPCFQWKGWRLISWK